LQGYNALDAALSRYFAAPARPPLSQDAVLQIMRDDYRPATDGDGFQEVSEDSLNERPRRSELAQPARGEPPRQMARRPRSRRLLSILSAVAAVLVIALVTAALFASRHGVFTPGNTKTPTATGQVAPTPTLPAYVPSSSDVFSSISMVSPTDGWIAGYNLSTVATPPLLLHYLDGKVFRETHLQLEVQGNTGVALTEVVMRSFAEGWAVGTYEGTSACSSTVLLHYNGGQWKQDSTFSGIVINSVAFSSSANGWAVGAKQACGQSSSDTPVMYHYDGRSWTLVTAPAAAVALQKVVMTSASDGWAIGLKQASGNSGNATTPGLLLHFDGNAWSEVSIPGLGQLGVVQFADISMASQSDGWLAGAVYQGAAATNAQFAGAVARSVMFHYDGKQWSKVSTAVDAARGDSAGSLSVASSGDGWYAAFGSSLFRLTNGKWSQASLPGGAPLTQVQTLSADDAWAIGGGEQPVLLHYQNGAWAAVSLTAAPASTATAQTPGVSPTAVPCPITYGPTPQPVGAGTTVPILPFTGWSTYTDPANLFTIKYPSGWLWEDDTCDAGHTSLLFFNYQPGQNNSPGYPAGGIKIELELQENSGLTAQAFWQQEQQADQQGVGGPACPSFTTRQLQVAGRSAVEGGCPSLRWDSYLIPAGKSMLVITESTAPGIHPSDILTQMVNSLTFTS
jgi:hypothetical protein